MATHSSTLAWRIPWTEEPGGLQSKGSQTVDMSEQLNTHKGRQEESESEERRVVDGDRPEWCSFWLWRWRREPGAKECKQPLKTKAKVAQSCLTLCDPMDYTVHGILQARVLEWVAFPFSRGSSQPMDWTQICIAGRFFTSWAKREAQEYWSIGVGGLSLLHQIFLTHESNWGLLHCGQILYQLNYAMREAPPINGKGKKKEKVLL